MTPAPAAPPPPETQNAPEASKANLDRRTPKARKPYAFLWFFMLMCVIFAAIILFVKG